MIHTTWKQRLLGCVFCIGIFPSVAGAWTISQNYDNQNVGDKCGNWGATKSTVTTAKSASGTKSCVLSISQGQTGYGVWGGEINLPQNLTRGNEVWVRIRTFMPNGFNYDSTSAGKRLKFLRFRTFDSSGASAGHVDWYINPKGSSSSPFAFIYEGEQVWKFFGGSQDAIQLGQWETYEYYIKFDNVASDQGGQARVRTWKNGKLMADISHLKTLKTSTGYSPLMRIFTYWNGGSPATQSMYVDDLTVTTDKPGNRDASGNAYLGMGAYVAPPSPPNVF